jgi:hypothetical protein
VDALSYDQVQVELARDIRQLAVDAVRFETWADDCEFRRSFRRAAELRYQRELALSYRSELMRDLWRLRQ